MSDPIDIPASRALCNAATPGPWSTSSEWSVRAEGDELVASCTAYHRHAADAEFIAHARTALPTALDEIALLRDLLNVRDDAIDDVGKVLERIASGPKAETLIGAAQRVIRERSEAIAERDALRATVERLTRPVSMERPAGDESMQKRLAKDAILEFAAMERGTIMDEAIHALMRAESAEGKLKQLREALPSGQKEGKP